MIKKIKKIKELGIFRDYSWANGLNEFNRYNLIYGWNGSGKTTLTDFFSAIEKGASEKYPDLEGVRPRDKPKTTGDEFNEKNIGF